MSGALKVTPSALTAAATQLDSVVTAAQSSPLGGSAMSNLLNVSSGLSGTRSAVASAGLAPVVDRVATGMVTTLQGLGSGLRVVADAYQRLDVNAGSAASSMTGGSGLVVPSQWGPPPGIAAPGA